MKLNGWLRIGVALSVLWALVAGFQAYNGAVERAENFVKFAYKTCTDAKMVVHDTDLSSCEKDKAANEETWMAGSGKSAVFTALAPIPLGWIAGLILVYGWRIVAAGCRATLPWGQMRWPQRSLTVVCGLTLCGALLFGSMTVMNLYTDAKVPVALSPFMDVVKTGDDLVQVKGTWTRQGRGEGAGLAFPLQTSTINCYRSEARCVEAKASVSENLLESGLVEYDVVRWTKDSIVMKVDDLCFVETFTIDLNTKAVSGAGHRVNGDSAYCKLSPSTETEWTYRMEKGFPVYWDIRSKARPAVLRIIQAIFGN